MLRAVIFDFNGVVVDDEPLHLRAFQKTLTEEGISLNAHQYYSDFLGMDDRGCFRAVHKRDGRSLDSALLQRLIERKSCHYAELIDQGISLFPGVEALIPKLASTLQLAIASGALKPEIETILTKTGLRMFFRVIVSAEDVSEGKPHPQIFQEALSRLNRSSPPPTIGTSECIVIEDSKEGIHAAHAAGMKCLAVTHSYPSEELTEAEVIVNSLEQVNHEFLGSVLSGEIRS